MCFPSPLELFCTLKCFCEVYLGFTISARLMQRRAKVIIERREVWGLHNRLPHDANRFFEMSHFQPHPGQRIEKQRVRGVFFELPALEKCTF